MTSANRTSYKISEVFGENTFSYETMKSTMSAHAFKALEDTIYNGTKLNMKVATSVAHALKVWALQKGATHYTHVFQPLVRPSAEKHNSFLSSTSFNNGKKPIERFDASELVQTEPDASSMPSGGMRSTFEARGYTAWDPTSPAFLVERAGTKTLCIPSVYFSYNGEALDKKTPLLRSIDLLDTAAKKVLELLKKPSDRILPMVGPEQEFFVISKKTYEKRPDLKLTGRTIFGSPSPKGQKLADHYFGSIPDRVLGFFHELEKEAYKLGIPLKTRHNEVAPCQFEIAPIFEDVNKAADHNALLMVLMERIADKHDLKVLFHEKPFANVNGSGKHNNWSLVTKEGRNLFDPSETKEEQLEFLLFLLIVVDAVCQHGDLLISTVANLGNEYRLGGNEAPPAIISIYLGDILTQIIENIVKEDSNEVLVNDNQVLDLGLQQLPRIRKDNSDRNRTSPFAFTGKKFEFRTVGSSQSLYFPNTFLNLAVAKSFEEAYEKLKESVSKDENIEAAILSTIKFLYTRSSKIIFNGNNYSKEWETEAKQRSLPMISSSIEGIRIPLQKESIEILSPILSKTEVIGRYEALKHRLASQIEIEATLLVKLTRKEIIPSILLYLSSIGIEDSSDQIKSYVQEVEQLFSDIKSYLSELEALITQSTSLRDSEEQVDLAVGKIKPAMERVRQVIDKIESYIPSKFWPYPTYLEILH